MATLTRLPAAHARETTPTDAQQRWWTALAGAGTLCLAFSLVEPVLWVMLRLPQPGRDHPDLVMPFELVPILLSGLAMLAWASVRSRRRRTPVLGCLALLGGLGLTGAVLTTLAGHAPGRRIDDGWQAVLLNASPGLAVLLLVALALAGAMLWHDLWRAPSARRSA